MRMTAGVEEGHGLAAGFAAHGGFLGQQQQDGSGLEQTAQALVALLGSGTQIPEVSHAAKPAREDVLQKETQELIRSPPPAPSPLRGSLSAVYLAPASGARFTCAMKACEHACVTTICFDLITRSFGRE